MNATQAEVEAIAAKWLRFAKDREGGRLERMRVMSLNREANLLQPTAAPPTPAAISDRGLPETSLNGSAPPQQIPSFPQFDDDNTVVD